MKKIKRGLLLTVAVACLLAAVGCDKDDTLSADGEATVAETTAETVAEVTEPEAETEPTTEPVTEPTCTEGGLRERSRTQQSDHNYL